MTYRTAAIWAAGLAAVLLAVVSGAPAVAMNVDSFLTHAGIAASPVVERSRVEVKDASPGLQARRYSRRAEAEAEAEA